MILSFGEYEIYLELIKKNIMLYYASGLHFTLVLMWADLQNKN